MKCIVGFSGCWKCLDMFMIFVHQGLVGGRHMVF